MPERLCEVEVTGAPFIVDHGDQFNDPSTLALTWSRTDGTRVTGLSFQANDITPPPGFANSMSHVSFEPWGVWPPTVTPPIAIVIGSHELRAMPSPNDTFAVAGTSGQPNASYGLRYAAHVDPSEAMSVSPDQLGAGTNTLLALAGTLERHLVLSTSMTAGRIDLLDNVLDPPATVATHAVGCGGVPLRGDALHEGDGWWLAVTSAAEGCGGDPTGLRLGRISHDGLLSLGDVIIRPEGFGRVRLVHHAARPWVVFSGGFPGYEHALWAAPVVADHGLGRAVLLASDFDPGVDFAVLPFGSGAAIARHSLDHGIVVQIYADLESATPSSTVDVADPGPHTASLSSVAGPSGYDLLVGWAAEVVDPPHLDARPRPFVARLGCVRHDTLQPSPHPDAAPAVLSR